MDGCYDEIQVDSVLTENIMEDCSIKQQQDLTKTFGLETVVRPKHLQVINRNFQLDKFSTSSVIDEFGVDYLVVQQLVNKNVSN